MKLMITDNFCKTFFSYLANVVIDVDCKVVARNFNETVSFRLLVDED